MQTTQTNLNLWNNLLEASGGALNPTKCTWAHFQWQPCNDLLTLQTQTQANTDPQLILSRLGETPQPLQKLQPYTSYRYLGVHLTMNGDWKKELQVLNNRNTKYLQVLMTCSLNRHEAKVIYRQCYLPAVTYPLPASVIPPDKLHDAQCSTTTAFLAKMGYPRTFPRAVVYAPHAKGGLRFCHFSVEQGAQKVLQVLKHIRANTTTGTIYTVLINHYQLTAGIADPVLENPILIPWSSAYWVDTLQAYLNHTKGKILLHNPWTPPKRRAHDQFIMEAILRANLTLTTHEQKILNNVCICLQANTLSDIVSHTGTHIRTECLHQEHPPNTRQHENPNRSTLQWPQHAPPSSANWKLWSRTLRKIFSSSNTSRLMQPLGSWTEHYDREYLWQ